MTPKSPDLPPKLHTIAIEAKLMQAWRDAGVYLYDPSRPRNETFAVDTPPPTVSGALHVGHVLSYTHTDLAARFWRMRGKNVFYPMGWDDNGLPTERRVQNLLKVRCEPHLPYDPDVRPDPKAKRVTPISRRNFLELCAQVTAEDEKAFEALWTRLGLSVDWTQTYATIDAHCRRVSQQAFLDLANKGEVYSSDAPTMWDMDFRTAVAQAEAEDREVKGLEFQLRFGIEGDGTLPIMTTRPELLSACVGVVVHPDDSRYAALVGKRAITPCFRAGVPICTHPLADPEKGTGAVMVCTFGDITDATWRDELQLATRIILGRDGRMLPVEWGNAGWESLDPASAQRVHDQIAGLTVKQAKTKMAEILADPANAADGTGRPSLAGEPQPITQMVRFYEKGEQPLEFLPTRQWFIRLLDKKDALLRQGRQIRWHPEFMRSRYEHWVEGLKYDWCVSRQRYFGVPIPFWYPLNHQGEPDYDRPIVPRSDQLPVDPMADVPPGYTASQRDQPGGFTGDCDVLDTWATSSLTPQIAAGWATKEDMFRRLYPMDIRPQAHEIIRTWAFYTIARAYMLDGSIPWNNVVISGWVLDPDRKKMSKSQGNVVTPMGLLDQYGADAARYWSASARLGTDTAYDESVFRIGKRLVTKIFNASKLIVGRLQEAEIPAGSLSAAEVTVPLDRAHLTLLTEVIRTATDQMEQFETAAALEATETWFWSNLCDNYLELTKKRAYAADRSALAAWSLSLSVVLRLFAPFLPYITDEVWSWYNPGDGPSIHTAPWPDPAELAAAAGDPAVFETAVAVLGHIRQRKSEAKVSIRVPVDHMMVTGPADVLSKLKAALDDVVYAGAIERAELCTNNAAELTVDFEMTGL